MGICINYRVKKLKSIRNRQKTILKARDIAKAILSQFKEMDSTFYVGKKCEDMYINFEGEGKGAESLEINFEDTYNSNEGKDSIFHFIKTQFAKNFQLTHIVVCEIMSGVGKGGDCYRSGR